MSEAKPVNVADLLPMGLIRSHCKCDDTPNITDEQLELYREVAFEQAEMFTGKHWAGVKEIVEPVNRAQYDLINRRFGRVRIKSIPIDGMVMLVGAGHNAVFTLKAGTNYIDLADRKNSWGNASQSAGCCSSCVTSNNQVGYRNFTLEMPNWVYKTGVKCKEDIPAGIRLGCLQFIAWAMENPGDIASPDSVRASGAMAQWNNYKRSMGF